MEARAANHVAAWTRFCVQAVLTLAIAGAAQAAPAVNGLATLSDSGARVASDPGNGLARFIGFDKPTVALTPPDPALQALPAQAAAQQHLSRYGALFGLKAVDRETTLMKHAVRDDGRTMTRFQQTHRGVPVIGGQLIVNQTAERKLTSIGGKVSLDLAIDVAPAISAQQAAAIALQSVSKWYSLPERELIVSTPELSIYDSKLITPFLDPVALVWRIDVTTVGGLYPLNEFMGIDAADGRIAIHFNQVPHAKNRMTYDNGGLRNDALPGTNLVCDESNPTCSGATSDAVYAHRFAGTTYDYYLSNFGRDSIDGLGMSLISTVRFCYTSLSYDCPYQNAFWNGSQMVYGTGYSVGEDVVAHELTHGVTSRESNLYYYYQSGAINESFSDVFGELVQQADPATTVTPATKWLMGEDLSIGAIRSMADPTLYSDPDRMTSIFYVTGTSDNGGVHTNSGVNNKAAYLMTDGDSFNGKTITGLGAAKVAHIYYEVQTNLLTSGADYLDLYYALYQGCQNLIGIYGITSNDCQQVKNAADAVEMNLQPVANFNPEAGTCPAGSAASNVFFDSYEAGGGLWTASGTSSIWRLQNWYVKSGGLAAFGSGGTGTTTTILIDGRLAIANPVSVPAGAYLRFDHAYDFETGFDGGIVEYSSDGTNWYQLTNIVDGRQFYSYPLSTGYSNPIGGKYAFSGSSHGYVSTRFDLSGLSGSTRFRWRIGTDSSAGSTGWWIDNVQIYTCAPMPPSSPPVITNIAAGPNSATISFTAPASNTGAPITGYTASCSAAGQATRTKTGTGSPITVLGLKAGISYSCSVTADNSAGSSSSSNILTVGPRRASPVPMLLLLLN